jgi:glycosyltransferase involved in cell wall biosynthesis
MNNNQSPSLISVIVPTCDRPDLLLQAIESITLQTYRPIEIIICDNGLVPINQKALEPYDVDYYYISPRVGASKARNYGVERSNGKFLAFLDDDDTWDKDFLYFMMKKIIENGLDCVYGSKYIKKNGVVTKYKTIKKSDLTLDVLLFSNPGVGGINLLVKKNIFSSIGGFDTSLPRGNDRAFTIDLILNCAIIGVESRAKAIMLQHDGLRLRDSHIEMLLWMRKYRRHMSTYSFFISSIRILIASANGKLRKLFSLI